MRRIRRELWWDLLCWVALILFTILSMLLLMGCRKERETEFELSPEGFPVLYAGSNGLTIEKAELYRLFDGAITRAAGELYRYGVDPATTRSVAYGTGFVLIDSARFLTPDGRWAYGANFGGKEIWVGIHRDHSGPPGTPYPADALPWTCRVGTTSGKSYWAVWNPDDTYPALGHEIGHTIFGAAFEHTYFPVVVNP